MPLFLSPCISFLSGPRLDERSKWTRLAKGRWHLCYQYAPDHVCWDAGMHWGHAVSHDLTRWEHWPIALYPMNSAPFSPEVLRSGRAREEGELVACFTHAHERGQVQSLAFSRDEGKTWTKYEGNPVLAIDRRDFRDPKIFRYGSEWRMTVAAGFEAQIYASSNLKEWTFLSTFPIPRSRLYLGVSRPVRIGRTMDLNRVVNYSQRLAEGWKQFALLAGRL